MHETIVKRLAATAALALVLAGCGGGGSTPAAAPAAVPTSNSSASGKTVPVTFSIVVPRGGSAHGRSAQYISAGTTTASISVNGGSAQTGSCTTGTCSVTVDAPIASDTFVVQLLDSSSHVLSQGSITQTVNGTSANTVTLAFDGVPKTVIISAATANIAPGTISATSAITVTVKDAAGDTIIGSDPFVDASGNPNPIALTNSDVSGNTSFTVASLTSPAALTSTFQYNGSGSLAGTAITIGATATSISVTTTTINVYAHHAIVEYAIPTGGAAPNGITKGPDGNVWFSEQNGGNVGYVTPAGTVQEYPVPGGLSGFGITTGHDGNLWFSDFGNTKIDRITPTGTVTEFTTGLSSGANPSGMVLGPNNNVFFGEFDASNGNRIGEITTAGTITESAQVGSGPQIEGVTVGSDGRIWFTMPFVAGSSIGAITTSLVPTLYATAAGTQLRGITSGPDGNLWFADDGNNKIGTIHTDGTGFAEYAPPTSNSSPEDITSAGGLLYFVEDGGNNIASVTTSGAIFHEYPVPTSNAQPSNITVGPDGNIWFTEFNGNKVGRFIL
jgi:streptogramin lyase